MPLRLGFDSRMSRFNLDFPFMIAPMVGLSHVSFRELVQSYVPQGLSAIRFTEMLSTRRLPNERLETTNELKCSENESFYIPQLLGNEEKYITPSVEKLLTRNPWGFDINMGCPTSHTLRHNWGVRLMGDKNYAAEVVRITKNATKLPVSVKLRGGPAQDEDQDYLVTFTEALEDAGADWITIHPRPRAQKHKGEANWSLAAGVRAHRKIPVVVNGDLQTSADALHVCQQLGLDGAMIARAATARPWILWQIAEDLGYDVAPLSHSGRRAPRGPEAEGQEYLAACLEFINHLEKYIDTEEKGLEKFRFFAATGARWLQFGHNFWKVSTQAKSYGALREGVLRFQESSDFIMHDRVQFS